MLVPGSHPPRKQRTSSSPSLRFFLKGLSIFSFWGESWSLQGLPTYPFLSSSKHLICLSTISFSFSVNSLFPSYSCLYSNIFIWNSITYSSQNLHYSFLLLDSLGPSASRAHSHRSMAKVPSPWFSSLISLWISNSQLPSIQVLPPLLFTPCRKRFTSLFSLCLYI